MNTKDSEFWNKYWRQLDAVFVSTIETLKLDNPQLFTNHGRYPSDGSFNKRGLLAAWLSLSKFRDPNRDEDSVVSFGVTLKDDAYTMTLDIADGAGLVLVDGPTRTVTMGDSVDWQADVLAYIAETKKFLDSNMELLRKSLNNPSHSS
jgi:hypothetical protein